MVGARANVPAGQLCTEQGLTHARAVNMRKVDTATFINNTMIESLLLIYIFGMCAICSSMILMFAVPVGIVRVYCL